MTNKQMTNKHMNHSDAEIESGILGLRAQSVPAPSRPLADDMLAVEVPRQRRLGAAAWTLAAGGALSIAVLVLLPQISTAEPPIRKLVNSYQGSGVLAHVTSYWIEGDKSTPKIWSGYVKGDRWHYVQDNYEQASDGTMLKTYFPNDGRLLVSKYEPAGNHAGSILPQADLSWWKSQDPHKITCERGVVWNGRRVDHYAITTYSTSWGATHNELFADPERSLPLYSKSVHDDGTGSALAWDYPDASATSLLEIKAKPGTRVEEAPASKSAGEGELPEKAQASSGG